MHRVDLTARQQDALRMLLAVLTGVHHEHRRWADERRIMALPADTRTALEDVLKDLRGYDSVQLLMELAQIASSALLTAERMHHQLSDDTRPIAAIALRSVSDVIENARVIH